MLLTALALLSAAASFADPRPSASTISYSPVDGVALDDDVYLATDSVAAYEEEDVINSLETDFNNAFRWTDNDAGSMVAAVGEINGHEVSLVVFIPNGFKTYRGVGPYAAMTFDTGLELADLDVELSPNRNIQVFVPNAGSFDGTYSGRFVLVADDEMYFKGTAETYTEGEIPFTLGVIGYTKFQF